MKLHHYLLLLAALTLSLAACGGDPSETETPAPVTPTPVTPTPEEPTPTATACQGWPADYGGVMLQAFWWDSYSESRWATLTAQADELAQYFQLIWVPNSGKTSSYYHNASSQTMGYDPCFWLDHTSCWGTEAELRQMIQAFKQRGTGVIEDVVINHKNGLNTWVDFPNETKGSYTITWDGQAYSDICSTDECNQNGYKTTGGADTGDNFDGYRDLDHTSQRVQQNVSTYLSYLLNDLGYVGFRYDMVKGYHARFTRQYNATAQPQYSVGECWDASKSVVTTWLNGTRQDGQIQSAAFDFPLKYRINTAIGGGLFGQMATATALANDPSYQRYAVTFIDNHDTYRDDNRLKRNVCAANAYILCMPGTPCLFLKHWQTNRGTLKRLIALRRAAGIGNQSRIVTSQATDKGYLLCVEGTKGQLRLLLGEADEPGSEWTMAARGKNYTVWAGSGVDLTALSAIADTDAEPEDDTPVTVPAFCTVSAGEVCAFFEAPAAWTATVMCWAWTDSGSNFTGGSWPGAACTMIGQTASGRNVWKWTYTGTLTTKPEKIIFNNSGQPQTDDLPFSNGGYYTMDGLQAIVAAN